MSFEFLRIVRLPTIPGESQHLVVVLMLLLCCIAIVAPRSVVLLCARWDPGACTVHNSGIIHIAGDESRWDKTIQFSFISVAFQFLFVLATLYIAHGTYSPACLFCSRTIACFTA